MDVKQVTDTLNFYIRPQTFPLALKLCQSESELPERARRPLRDLGYQIALCQGEGLARRYGWTMAIGKEDQCCAGGATAMGFLVRSGGQSTRSEKALDFGKYSHLLIAPIQSATFEPDVVVLYVNSAQAMRLVQAISPSVPGVAQAETPTPRQGISAIASGFQDCGDVVARTTLSDECQFILPSGGDRVFGGTQDDELIFAMPRSKIEAVLQGLENTHRAGFRYPIVTDLRHRPELPPFLQMPKEA